MLEVSSLRHHQTWGGETKKRKHKVRQLESLWRETKIGDMSPWEDIADEAEGLLAIRRRESYLLVIDSVTDSGTSTARLAEMPHTKVTMMKSRKMTKTWDETDPHNDVIFGRRRSDSVVDDLTNKVLFVLESKRSSDQRRDYRERGES